MSALASPDIRILLLDQDTIARAGLKLLLEGRPGFTVVAQAGEKDEALKLAQQRPVDIVVIRDNTPNSLAASFSTEILAAARQARLIWLTALCDQQQHLQAIQNGVVGIVLAQNQPEVLYKAIEKVHAGEVWLDRSLIASYITQKGPGEMTRALNFEAAKIALLSERERDVISLVGDGLKNQQIADQLYLSEVTVRHHLTSIYKKLGVTDRLELVIYAYQNGLAELPE